MKIALINGSPHEKGCTYTDLEVVSRTLKEEGVDSEIFWLGLGDVPGCRSCGSCRKSHRCIKDGDLVNMLTARFDEFDGFVFGSPVYYSGTAGQVCSFMDRFFYVNSGKFPGKVGVCIVNARRGGDSASYERMNQYFLKDSMIVVGSQYWNFTHGNKAEQVVKDEEGMQNLRTLSRNIAWILKCLEAGKKAGIALPEREPPIMTNFIR